MVGLREAVEWVQGQEGLLRGGLEEWQKSGLV
jgi:hypothetical protein